VRQLEKEIRRNKELINDTKLKYNQETEQARIGLKAINEAANTAQDNFRQQKNQMQAELNAYLTQYHLTLQKVHTAVAILNNELNKAGLTAEDTEQLTQRIRTVGSLVVIIRELDSTKIKLQSEISQLTKTHQDLTSDNKRLRSLRIETDIALFEKRDILKELESEIESIRKDYVRQFEKYSYFKHDQYITKLIIGFLSDPKRLSQFDFDNLIKMMIAVRQVRRGDKLGSEKYIKGHYICECPVPRILSIILLPNERIDSARELLASYIAPLARDKFVSKTEHEMTLRTSILNTILSIKAKK